MTTPSMSIIVLALVCAAAIAPCARASATSDSLALLGIDSRALQQHSWTLLGALHSCTILSSGGVACVGDNYHGQLNVPGALAGVTTLSQVCTGYTYSCALNASGAFYCWGGLNPAGGGGTTAIPASQTSPGASFLSCGSDFLCAITAPAGGVACWGQNNYGALKYPESVLGGTPATILACGWYHACASNSTAIACWGDGTFGQSAAPSLPSGTVVGALSAGRMQSCMMENATGAISCFGNVNMYAAARSTAQRRRLRRARDDQLLADGLREQVAHPAAGSVARAAGGR